jgi:hypothetical protein
MCYGHNNITGEIQIENGLILLSIEISKGSAWKLAATERDVNDKYEPADRP